MNIEVTTKDNVSTIILKVGDNENPEWNSMAISYDKGHWKIYQSQKDNLAEPKKRNCNNETHENKKNKLF